MWRGRTLVLFVSSVEHQLLVAELQHRPIEMFLVGLRPLNELEAQFVAVKRDGSGHVENLQKRRAAFDFDGHNF